MHSKVTTECHCDSCGSSNDDSEKPEWASRPFGVPMTILCCWREKEIVRCLADARLTFDEANPGIAADVGSKLAVVPTSVWGKVGDGQYARTHNHSFGFAFAGSSLIGATTFLRASSITQLLRADGEAQLPSVEDVASLFARVSTANTREVKATLPDAEPSSALIFGYCPVQSKPRVFQLSPAMRADQFETVVQEVFPTRTEPLLVGTGSALFQTVARELFDAGVPRDVAEVFVRTLRDPRAREHRIGGVPSSMTSNAAGTSVDLILFWDGLADGVSEYVLGLAIQDAGGSVGKLGVAYQAREPDYLYRLGEKMLRDEGVVENELATRESLRDLAVIGYMTELALKMRDQPNIRVLPGTFYVHAYAPAIGEHCYCAQCPDCHADVPLFRDVSGGAIAHPLMGSLLLRSCLKCGKPMQAVALDVFPRTWSGST